MLWTDIIDPATLTGYARASLADYEARKGTLARWLPNRTVADVVARFVAGQTGLVNVASFRAYDAEPEIGKRQAGKRVTLELPALGQNIPVSEYEQLRARGGNVSDAQALATIQRTTDVVTRAVSDAIERMRGIVLQTGKATISQANFQTEDDFGRAAGHTVVAATPWSTATADALADLATWSDTYEDANGEPPGSIVMSRRVLRSMANLNQFRTQLASGSTRPATVADVNAVVTAAGLPEITVYNRRVSVDGVSTKVLSDDRVLLLPEAVDVDDWQGTELGATFWGRTLTSTDSDWGIEDTEQPGIVAGVYRNPKPPMGIEVISDAIGLPVLANANLSFVADVL
ncbi:MAG TPA: major capsid protein [Phytomonospora sp.]|nr:major capsid protein E [Streptomycetaceae bacterium]